MTQTSTTRPRVLIVAGYFDWFSGYQETALASALSSLADVHVMASDRVSPAFSEAHLARLGLPRRYPVARTRERGVTVTRFPSLELRSMVWSHRARRQISAERCDLIIQVMPGQILSAAPTFTRNRARKVALYGDNRAMWSHLNSAERLLKGVAFTLSKGLLYTAVNLRAHTVYAYTPDTRNRLRPFSSGRKIRLMPLCYASKEFYVDEIARVDGRMRLGYSPADVVIISAGKFDPRKQLELLLAAFDRVAHGDPSIHLIIVGDDASNYSQNLRRIIRGLGTATRIRIEPFAASGDLNTLFNAADLGVWPRNPAITIQQAMATGLPVILPWNDLVGHLLGDESGRYFTAKPGTEVPALAETLIALTSECNLKLSAVRRNRAISNSWLSAETIAKTLLAEVAG